jgi:hypothetical protein
MVDIVVYDSFAQRESDHEEIACWSETFHNFELCAASSLSVYWYGAAAGIDSSLRRALIQRR